MTPIIGHHYYVRFYSGGVCAAKCLSKTGTGWIMRESNYLSLHEISDSLILSEYTPWWKRLFFRS